ncbi:MAG: ABC transporter ATP-binding protein, partial [Kiritimatiellota bacterium]|nr:ABC transporter ATP-binding protein [Kiritimatiellota bacterium]
QMIFQDPQSSLNSRMTIGQIIKEPLYIHRRMGSDRGQSRLHELLRLVGLAPNHLLRFPHELSGGQRQRVGIARALALEPRLLVCDEAVSALDVSVRAQILNLLNDLQERLALTYIFISHDLSVVHHFCHRIAVMYLGNIVEISSTGPLFAAPLHPYTVALLSAVPLPDPNKKRNRLILSGDVPSPVNPPPGCRFHPRCWMAADVCRTVVPQLRTLDGDTNHAVSCHRAEEVRALAANLA